MYGVFCGVSNPYIAHNLCRAGLSSRRHVVAVRVEPLAVVAVLIRFLVDDPA